MVSLFSNSLLTNLFFSRSAKVIHQSAELIVRACRDQVVAKISDHFFEMETAEKKGYIKAISALIVLRETDRFLAEQQSQGNSLKASLAQIKVEVQKLMNDYCLQLTSTDFEHQSRVQLEVQRFAA